MNLDIGWWKIVAEGSLLCIFLLRAAKLKLLNKRRTYLSECPCVSAHVVDLGQKSPATFSIEHNKQKGSPRHY